MTIDQNKKQAINDLVDEVWADKYSDVVFIAVGEDNIATEIHFSGQAEDAAMMASILGSLSIKLQHSVVDGLLGSKD